MTGFAFDRLLICGLGLMGSSLARALRAAHRSGVAGGRGEIVAIDRDRGAIDRALKLGIIDSGLAIDLAAGAPSTPVAAPGVGRDADGVALTAITAVDNASSAAADLADLQALLAAVDLAVLAVPVAQTRATLATIAPWLSQDAIITDLGSTKADVSAVAKDVLGESVTRFVAGHPIAGGEVSGVDAGRGDLFQGRAVIVCPTTETAPAATVHVIGMWQAAGAAVTEMDAVQHDRLLASISHLPHLLAYAFIEHIIQSEHADACFAFAGGGFRDFTRIAASNPEMWRDIFIANRDAVLGDLDHFIATLSRLRAAVAAGDGDTLTAVFARSREKRSAWGNGSP